MEITKSMRKEIENDIVVCQNHDTAEGSRKLLREIIAKYSLFDNDFEKNVCPISKACVPGHEPDYRKELSSAASRLKGILLSLPEDKVESSKKAFQELLSFIPEIEEAFSLSFSNTKVIFNKKIFIDWREQLKYQLRSFKQDETIIELISELDSFNGWNDKKTFDSVTAKCRIIYENIADYIIDSTVEGKNIVGNIVFIVHGHDVKSKIEVARTIENLGLDAVILHEQPDQGKTIIEKLEEQVTDASFAIVIYTESDDIGRDKTKTEEENQFRARQNVVFEHGLFIGALGRSRVCALVQGTIEKPGDLDGVIYIPMDDAGAWKIQLCKNMKAVGLNIDMNLL